MTDMSTEILLHDNVTVTRDPRMDLIPSEPDSRDLILTSSNPVIRDVEWQIPEFLDQGREGACVAYAFGHALLGEPPQGVRDITDRWLVERLYWNAQRKDPFPGGAYPGADPHMEGTTLRAALKVLKAKGMISEYRFLREAGDVRWALQEGIVVLGTKWYGNMNFVTLFRGIMKTGGTFIGGHAYAARAYRQRGDLIRIRNSWGRRWARGGEAWMRVRDLENLWADYGEAVVICPNNRTSDVVFRD